MKKIALLLSFVVIFTAVPAGNTAQVKKISADQYFDHILKRIQDNGNKIPLTPDEYKDNKYAKGSVTPLVLLFEFKDRRAKLPLSLIKKTFEQKNGPCLASYFKEASYGKLIIDYGPWGIKDWMEMPRPLASYQPKSEDPSSYMAMFRDAYRTALDNGVDIKPYDKDGNGTADIVIYIWAGNSWSFKGDVPGSFCIPDSNGSIISIAENNRPDYKIPPFPPIVALHEFGHAIMLWDLYDYEYKNNWIGGWDLMAEGVWDEYCGLNAFQRWQAGWIDIETIDKPGTYTVDNLNGDGKNKAFFITIPFSPNECILVENRQKTGGDSFFNGCPGEGLVFYKVNMHRPYVHLFNTIQGSGFATPGIEVLELEAARHHIKAFFSLESGRTKLNIDTVPKLAPTGASIETIETLSITDISTSKEEMSFTLTYKDPGNMAINLQRELNFGRVAKGRQKTIELPISAIKENQAFTVYFQPENKWIFTDVSAIMTGAEPVKIIVDTTFMGSGPNSGYLSFTSNGGEGKIRIVVDVAPRMGDVNMDGDVNIFDFIEFEKHYMSVAGDVDFNENADFNFDGKIDAEDLIMLGAGFDYVPK
jgi:M6 family metalloprotease-like protein